MRAKRRTAPGDEASLAYRAYPIINYTHARGRRTGPLPPMVYAGTRTGLLQLGCESMLKFDTTNHQPSALLQQRCESDRWPRSRQKAATSMKQHSMRKQSAHAALRGARWLHCEVSARADRSKDPILIHSEGAHHRADIEASETPLDVRLAGRATACCTASCATVPLHR